VLYEHSCLVQHATLTAWHVLAVLGLCTRQVRHTHSMAGRSQLPLSLRSV